MYSTYHPNMKRIHIAPLYPSSLLLLFITLLVARESTTIYTPIDDINLNCGSSDNTTSDYDFQTWTGDINSKFFPKEVGNTSQVAKAPPSFSTGSQVPYTTARLSYSEFTYRFSISPGQKFIRLYFFPATYNADFDRSKSLFSVKAGGYRLIKDFNASLSSTVYGGSAETILREYCVNFEPEQRSLNITFTPSKDGYAFINGIEIMSMPTNLYHSAAQGDGASYLGSSGSRYYIENNTALEMIYRINVGGSPVSPSEDTGMYRTWNPTDKFYLDNVSSNLSFIEPPNNIHLNFVRIPNYTAPEEVYRTGRTMGKKQTINKNFNLTWRFPVDAQSSYLVRLHFCEIDPDITKARDRMFQIFIAKLTAELHADIISWTTGNIGNGIPIYMDYIVPMPSLGTQKKGLVNLFVELQAYQGDSEILFNGPILNGLEIFKLFDSNGNNNVNLNQDPPTQAQMHKILNKSTPVIAIIAGVLSSILVFFALGFLVIKRRWKAKDSSARDRATKSTKTPGSPIPSYLCRYFSLAEIKAATKNFNDTLIIGAGGFGNVYKACIDGGAIPVAIKRLKPESSQGAHEFKTEIEMLSQLRHRHLVSLIGYCADKGEMILVYDYMARGTLRNHLYHTDNQPLPWEQRLQICIGTARGLQYLHSGTKGTIIHRDVKSTNILLDDKWVAKVSDFGLSKGTTNMSKTHINTVVKGSFGYLDPEYYRRQRLTEKSDVYSLGVVLFEVLCARPAVIQTEELKQANLAEWAKSCHQNEELDQIIDPSLRGKIAAECLNKFTEIAINCMHDNGTERPSMTDVVRGLELALQLQQCAEGNINCIERNVEIETSSSEQRCATNDSIKCISATIFSEINNPSGR